MCWKPWERRIDLGPEQVARCVQEVGFGFMFAPAYHPAMKHVGPTRREIGIRTVFNILGPLTNPAHTRYQVLGVADGSLLRKMGEVLLHLGCQHALIIHGEDGIDECSLQCANAHLRGAPRQAIARIYHHAGRGWPDQCDRPSTISGRRSGL